MCDMKQIGRHFIGLLAVCTLAAGFSVQAAEDSVVLQGKENQALATLELADRIMGDGQKEPREDAVSLQLSFQVETTQGNAGETEAVFQFGEDTAQGVHSYRYHKDTGILTIYISGGKNLFQGDLLSLGQVVVNSSGEHGVTASVRVVEDSLRVVNSAGDMQKGSVNAPGRVICTLGNGGVPPQVTPEPENPGDKDNSGEDQGTGGGDSSQGGARPSGSGSFGSGRPEAGISGGGSAAASVGNVIRRPGTGAVEKPETDVTGPKQEELETEEKEQGEEPEEQPDTPREPSPFFQELKENTDTDMLLYAGLAIAAVVLAATAAIFLVMREGAGGKKRKKRRRKRPEQEEL